jgi:3-hydroxybutyryl-CoA dehydrogenase
MSSIAAVVVVGAGTMGHGIAHVCAASGYRVRLQDADRDAARRGVEQIRRDLDKGVELGKVTEDQRHETLNRIVVTSDLERVLADADLVIEAVPESFEIKEAIFQRVDALAPPHALVASNTSSLSIGRLAEGISEPERFVGLHFFNPVHLMKLVEVVRGPSTSEATVEAAVAFARSLGKEPIVVRDAPGFASSRLGIVLGMEAIRMVEQGVATPEDIDRAMELGYRHPMGPLRLTDLVGLDVRLGIAEYLHEALGSEAFRPPELLRRMVAEGRLGKKSGRGFYEWSEGS